MELFLTFCLIGAVAAASPLNAKVIYPSGDVKILRYENENVGLGDYRFYFEQSDGTKQEQQGTIKNEGTKEEALVVRGAYSWVGPDGVTYSVTYVADENGFQPQIEKHSQGSVPSSSINNLLG